MKHDNILSACKAYLDEFGAGDFEMNKMIDNGHSDLASAISQRTAGIISLRKELNIEVKITALKRKVNLESLKRTLLNLKLEGVAGLTPSQMLILLQQGGYDKLTPAQGGDIYESISKGLLTPQGLIDWSQSEEISPNLQASQEQVDGSPRPISPTLEHRDDYAESGYDSHTDLDTIEELVVIQSSHEVEEDTNFSALALVDPKNQLRFLDGVVFAADDLEAVAALKSITLHQLWAKAYLSPEDEAEVVVGVLPHLVVWVPKDQCFVSDRDSRTMLLDILLLLLLPLRELIVHAIGWDDALFSCL